jgi:hypothetical protein
MHRLSRAISVIGVAALIAAVLPINTASARILTPPSAPRQVAVVNPTEVSLDVTWIAPITDGGSPITDYTVSYIEGFGNFLVLHTSVTHGNEFFVFFFGPNKFASVFEGN